MNKRVEVKFTNFRHSDYQRVTSISHTDNNVFQNILSLQYLRLKWRGSDGVDNNTLRHFV